MKKPERIRSEYALELTVKQFKKIPSDWTGEYDMSDELREATAAEDIEYSGHFGPYVYYSLQAEDDTEQEHAKIMAIVAKHVGAKIRNKC